jgi:hypothetical protein
MISSEHKRIQSQMNGDHTTLSVQGKRCGEIRFMIGQKREKLVFFSIKGEGTCARRVGGSGQRPSASSKQISQQLSSHSNTISHNLPIIMQVDDSPHYTEELDSLNHVEES